MIKLKDEMSKFKEKLQNSDIIERDYSNHNVIIFGLEEYHQENNDTMYRVLDLFVNEMQLNIYEEAIDNFYWLGNRRGYRPLLLRITRVIMRDT